MEDLREDVDALLAHWAEKLGMRDGEPHEIAAMAAIQTYEGFTRNGIKEQIDMAINFARISLRYEYSNPDITNNLLSNLGLFLESRYKRVGDIADLEEAIQVARQAVASTPEEYSALASRLNGLGNKLQSRYERTGDIVDLEESIQIARHAIARHGIASIPDNDPSLAVYLNNLSNNLERRYERTGDIANLEEAIQITRQIVASTPEDYSNLVIYLNNLGNNLESQYERTGDIANLKEAIQVARQAVASTPEDYSILASCLNNLSNKLESLYKWTGEMADLEEAIQIARQAVASTPENHSDLAGRLSNLCTKIGSQYERTGDITALEEAIRAARQAVALTPEGHSNLAGRLSNLSAKLGNWYEQIGDMAALEEAIQVDRRAVALTPKDHSSLASNLNNLGLKLECCYKQKGDIADLEEAIQVARRVVALTPENHSHIASRLNNLGIKLEIRYNQTGDMANLVEANRVFGHSWTSYSSVPFTRIYAASQCLKLLFRLKEYDKAAEIAVSVTDFLPTINSRSLDRDDRQHVVSRFAGIAADACGVLLQARDPETALQYLEKGRAVILGQMIDNWSDLSSLKKAHPELATKFKTLRDIVNARSGHSNAESDRLLAAQRRRAAAAELELCIQSIQSVPGQELFMAAQSIEAMQACAVGGNIVVVNISQLRSDAIIVSPTGIRTIRLTSLSAADAEVWIGTQWHGLRSERGARNKEYSQFLKWLWEVCVQHILDAIGFTEIRSIEYFSRIWWIGTGLASSMPFHAAGDHSPGSTKNTFNHVISSYAPSIKALSYSRSRCSVNIGLNLKALIATMPVTPDMKLSLSGVLPEKTRVMEILRQHTTVEEIEQPSAEAVIHSIEECNIAHFACHGRTNRFDPSRSGLILQRKDKSGSAVQDVLTVHDLSEINLQHARLVYLSACSTAENKATSLADEAIHVVSGFQVAGFPHVIGCLWPSVDRVCVEVAHGFYASLVKEGVLHIESRSIAEALHTSIMEARAKERKQPLNWAQFVHYGA